MTFGEGLQMERSFRWVLACIVKDNCSYPKRADQRLLLTGRNHIIVCGSRTINSKEVKMVKCNGCGSTEKSGKIFYQCSACGRWWCSSCGYAGKKCICGRGYLKEP